MIRDSHIAGLLSAMLLAGDGQTRLQPLIVDNPAPHLRQIASYFQIIAGYASREIKGAKVCVEVKWRQFEINFGFEAIKKSY